MLCAAHTDIGNKKKVNQDSVVIRCAKVLDHMSVLASVCDGMGGLANGEVASAEAVDMLDKWFDASLPPLFLVGLSDASFKESMNRSILEADARIGSFSDQEGDCGTTVCAVFLYAGHYCCVNVGDSRVYRISGEEIVQLTHDQSVIQDMIDRGELTPEEAVTHPDRNVLLQCVGAGGDVVPAYSFGKYEEGDVFLVCSDGLRHKLTPDEMVELFYGPSLKNEDIISGRILRAIEKVKERGEKDNISLAVVKMSDD